jgi:hypothetical protein
VNLVLVAHGTRNPGGIEVVEGAVDVTAGQVMTEHRRNERVGPGCQDQRVVAVPLAVCGQHRLRRTVDLDDPAAQQQPDPLVGGIIVAG